MRLSHPTDRSRLEALNATASVNTMVSKEANLVSRMRKGFYASEIDPSSIQFSGSSRMIAGEMPSPAIAALDGGAIVRDQGRSVYQWRPPDNSWEIPFPPPKALEVRFGEVTVRSFEHLAV